MNKIDLNIETVSCINYQFTAIPTNLFFLLDNNCRSTLFALIQLSTYYAKDNGYFYRTNSDLEVATNLSKNLVNASLDALYINGLIDVIPSAKGQGKKQSGKHFKVNFEKFLEYESISIEDAMKNEELKIYTPNYKGTYTPSFNNDTKCNTTSVTTLVTTLVPTLVTTLVKSDNNIDNINNINKIDNIDKINNIKEKNTTLEQYNEINVNSKINKFEIKEVNLVGNEKKDMLLQSILNFKSSLENYKNNKPLAISIANGFYEKNKTSIEECNLNSVWDDVMNLINNIPTVEQNIPTLDDEEDETYHYQDERSEFDKKLDAYARQVATGKLNFSTIM